MLVYPLVAGLFLVGVAVNLFESPPDWPNVFAGTGIAVVMMTMWAWMRFNARRRQEAMKWLLANRKQITDEPQYFRDSPFPSSPISSTSNFRDFKVVTSALIVTVSHTIYSGPRGSFLHGVIATLWTLAFGWWGIPWGPVRTLQALISNLSGGEKTAVLVAISPAEMAKHPEP